MKKPLLKAVANDSDLKPIIEELAGEIDKRVGIQKNFEGIGDLIWKYSNTVFQWISQQDTKTVEFEREFLNIGGEHNDFMSVVTKHLADDRSEEHLTTARIKTLFSRTTAISTRLNEIREALEPQHGIPSRYRRHKPSKSTLAIYLAHTRSIKIIELLDSFNPKLWLELDRIFDLIDKNFERLSSYDEVIHDFNILEMQCIANLMRVGIDTHKARQEEFDYEIEYFNKRSNLKDDLEKFDYSSRFDDILRKCNEFIRINSEGRPTAPKDIDDKLRAAAEEKAVGEMFARAREGAGLSKVAASKVLGGYPKDIRNIENGEHSATLRKIREYADALGYNVQLELIPKDNG